MSEGMISLLISGTIDTIIMTFVSAILGFILGIPTGVLLYVTRRGQVMENTVLYSVISAVVNVFRSIPFIILLVWISPFTKFIVGSAIGIEGAIVPLTVGAIPFIARMVENALLEVPNGLIEASRAMGATPLQIIRKVLLPESLPGLINAATITLIMLVGYSAMGGAVGSGGLGQIAMQYGYYTYNPLVMNTVLVLLIVLVFIIQFTGEYLMKKVSHK
ncbi:MULTISPECIES: methionine ABC transporter permease MetI [Providencia]|jgi:D-methionine transport system permease protein|uniref:D-methionine transport system permease protein MetI n=2 Tax=Providencia TaxID=586 RepID=A0AAW9VD47_9GAMM|nr:MULTISPECIES: methionine ABC transporter permease MetI [Providencia]MTC74980.1 methionine ABC transporter permease MetI [Providencia sp. wls1919]ETT04217.1 D-methionine transport system permease protein MetI [Providencia alcalifaciens F90-2004]EUC94230.1 D-methionine transport system permease protein MetI [Providencia alcalifaciens PAL-2]EUD05487.1 D-methionine transport system permease protein MetI [Providencia alcalifaciens R90-1475]MBF0691572.1 methionine ABC transporter permease MetI [P